MAAAPRLRITKSMPWRGGTREYSNTYHFAGGTPADAAAWETFADAVVASEVLMYTSDVTITGATGYTGGATVAAFSKSYSSQGSASYLSYQRDPGECAILLRWSTAIRSSKNHPVYLFNYFHPAYSDSANPDSVKGTYITAMQTYADTWLTGYSVGADTYVRCGPDDAAIATDRTVEAYVTHRDFPR